MRFDSSRFARSVALLSVLIVCLCGGQQTAAQIVEPTREVQLNTDSLKRAFADQHYYFGLYKDNYFIFGPSLKHPTKENTNIKFQISIAQKLTKSTLPLDTYLYLFYTQKVFWNVLENSMPMTDLNFNPGVGLAKPIFIKNKFIGKAALILEHESNGRDGDSSRSWNRVSFSGSVMVDPNFVVSGKIWIPIIDGVNNKDILKYCGFYQFGWQFMTNNRKFSMSALLTNRTTGFFNYNVCVEAAWRWSTGTNQYLFAQFYTGYGEGLLDYNIYKTHLRVGIVIKPTLFSEF